MPVLPRISPQAFLLEDDPEDDGTSGTLSPLLHVLAVYLPGDPQRPWQPK